MVQIYISLGSNIDREANLARALDSLHARFGELQLSPVYESEAVGFAGDAFFNMVVGAQTDEPIATVVACFKAIEDANGRERGGEKFSSRTLDLDLLTYAEVVCQQPVVLPREEILYNAFVLQPLADIAAAQIHPIAQQSYGALWQAFDKSQQSLWPVPFRWRGRAL